MTISGRWRPMPSMWKRSTRPARDGASPGMRADSSGDTVLTIDELAVYLKLAKSTMYKLAQEGKIPGQKVGRHWRFHKVVIDRWLGNEDSGGGGR